MPAKAITKAFGGRKAGARCPAPRAGSSHSICEICSGAPPAGASSEAVWRLRQFLDHLGIEEGDATAKAPIVHGVKRRDRPEDAIQRAIVTHLTARAGPGIVVAPRPEQRLSAG